MFRGVNTLNLDGKGRMAMPTRYRESLRESSDGQLILTVDPEHCLLVYPLHRWEEIEQNLTALPELDRRARRLKRLLLGHATECDMDGQGRILLPPPLREFAGLNKRVVLIGQGNKFELWDEATWIERREQWLEEEAEALELSPVLENLSY